MSFDNLKTVLDELCTMRDKIKNDTKRADELSATVKQALSGPTGDTMVGGVVFSLKINKGRASYDMPAMLADGIDIEKYAKIGAPIAVLSVKRVNQLD